MWGSDPRGRGHAEGKLPGKRDDRRSDSSGESDSMSDAGPVGKSWFEIDVVFRTCVFLVADSRCGIMSMWHIQLSHPFDFLHPGGSHRSPFDLFANCDRNQHPCISQRLPSVSALILQIVKWTISFSFFHNVSTIQTQQPLGCCSKLLQKSVSRQDHVWRFQAWCAIWKYF